MQHINNLARFNQQMNYFGFPMQATDVDSVTHIKGKFYLFNEAKCEGTDVTRGQLIFFRELIEDLGSRRPAFYVVTHHSTRPEDFITGEGLKVSTVIFKAPHVTKLVEYDYPADERPTLNEFTHILALVADATDKLKGGRTALDITNNGWDFFKDFSDLTQGTIKALSNDELMQSFAELEYWDDENLSPEQKAFMWACGHFDTLSFYDQAYTTWVNHNQSNTIQ